MANHDSADLFISAEEEVEADKETAAAIELGIQAATKAASSPSKKRANT